MHIDEGRMNYSWCTQGLFPRGRTSKLLCGTLHTWSAGTQTLNAMHSRIFSISFYFIPESSRYRKYNSCVPHVVATSCLRSAAPLCVSCRSPVHRGSPVKPHRGELETSQWLEVMLQRSITPRSPPPITCSAHHPSTLQEETNIIPQLI